MLVHGVGMWPGLFSMAEQRLLPLLGHRWIRPGYGGQPLVEDLARQTDLLAEFCEELAARSSGVVVVGVSGGATLALALALRHPSLLRGIVSHEPLIGSLQPDLHARVRAAGEALERDPSEEAARHFVSGLYGESVVECWPPEADDWIAAHWPTICAEVRHFADFEPSLDQLAHQGVPHLTTVGRNSPVERHEVADALGDRGAERRVLDSCGHLAPLQAPAAFAGAVEDLIERVGA